MRRFNNMKTAILSILAVLILTANVASAADPVVSNVRAVQRTGTKLVDITYDVSATGAVTVSATVSTNSGVIYDLPATHFSGDYGAGVTPGAGRQIVWDAGADWDGHYSTSMRIKVTADDGVTPVLPPDPATVATAPSNGVVTLIGDSTAFLYTGANAIQTGVAAGTIDGLRVAVLRGNVLDQNGAPLSGVTVKVNQHAEFGQTLTRTNGAYDLAVNGGGPVSINFSKTGYLTIQRTLDLPWRDYVPVDDVVLKTADANVMVATLPSTNAQAVYGSLQTDTDGSRQAVVIIPANTRAYVFTSSGATQETATLTTHLTEFTVGTNGLAAMPGDLPAMVAYTYALELAAEEAQVKIAGRDVLFATNVYFYVDNFLGMPTGIQVPMGYYDDTAAAWIPSQDGRVVQLAGTNASGLAELIVATNGVTADAAALAAMGFTDDERRLLAVQYGPAVTQTLWRVPIAHFSRHDSNFGTVTPGGEYPNNPKPSTGNVNDPSQQGDYGRLVIENQLFQETIPISGTPLYLCYSSARVPGFLGNSAITIPLSGASYPSALQRIHLQVSVAGLTFTNSFAPATNLNYTFSWNGLDAYQRSLMGTMPVTVRIGYEYLTYYALPPYVVASFGLPSGTRIPGNIIARNPTILWQEHQIPLTTSSRSTGLGWWSLSEYHNYDPAGKILHMGDGTDIDANATYDMVVSSFAGNGNDAYSGDGGPATNAAVGVIGALAVAPNGSVYIAGWGVSLNHQTIRCVDTNGYIWHVAGRSGNNIGWGGDGGAATNALFDDILGIAVGRDGSIYICDRYNYRVRKVDTNGIINTVAGNGTASFSGDGGPATNAAVKPWGIAVAPDGTLYIAERENYRVRRVGPDGIIQTLAGKGSDSFSGDGGPATNAQLSLPNAVCVGPDGAVYVSDSNNGRVRRIGTDGIINTVAGKGLTGSSDGDGGAATNAHFRPIQDVAVGSDGTLYIADYGVLVRQVTSDGIVRTIAGTGVITPGSFVNNAPATSADIRFSSAGPGNGLATGPDGSIYYSDSYNHYRLLKISRAMPGVRSADTLLASGDGARIFHFDQQGRHLKTYHAWTGATLYEFSHTNGYLSTVTDGYTNVLRIVRNAAGTPQEIVTPDDRHTALTLNADGFLWKVQNPANEMVQLGYTTNGLLTSVQGARGVACTYTMSYNSTGQIVSASDPGGGSTSLRRSGVSNGFEVASTSALGRATIARVELLPTGDERRTQILPDGSTQEQWQTTSGAQTNRYPSGTTAQWTRRPDPRFGMLSPVISNLIVRMPSGLAMTVSVSRAVSLTNQSWTSVAYLTNSARVNGRTWTLAYTGGSRQLRVTSPVGRSYQMGLGSQGRRAWLQDSGTAMISNSFDGRGRLTNICYGTGADARSFTLTYDSAGYIGTLTDPLGRILTYTRDAVGRVTTMLMPDSSSFSLDYDEHGNRTALTPPGRSEHAFAYDNVDQAISYTAPAAAGVTNLVTTYAYNADRQRLQLVRPDDKSISNAFNSAGYLASQTTDIGSYGYGWSNGFIRSLTAPDGVNLAFGYDGFLVTTARWSGVVTGQVSYAYNTDLGIRSIAVNGTSLAYDCDADGLITNAGACRLTRALTNGLLTGIDVGPVAQTLAYNQFVELTNLTATYAGSNLFTEVLGYDKAGRITSRVEVVQNSTNTFVYGYDTVSRLTRVVTNETGTNVYGYDANGNRTNWVTSAGSFTATYDGQDRLTQWQGPAFTSQYAYSQAGDLTNRVVNTTNSTIYTYDAKGNLRCVILSTGVTNDYLADGLGRRMGKKVNGVFTNGWLYIDWLKPVAELNASSNMANVFVYGSRPNVPDYMVKTGVTYRIVSDHLGSVRLVVRADTGEIAQRLDYDEWGRVLNDSAPGFQPFGFAGGLYDHDTGLVRFGLRDYDPETGRWTRKDPLLFAGGDPNLYAYVGNSPIRYLDMTGTGPFSGEWVADMLSFAGDISNTIGVSDYSTGGYVPGGKGAFPWAGGAGVFINSLTFLNSANTGSMPDMIHDCGMLICGAASLYIPVVGPIALAVDYGSKALFNAYFNSEYSATSGPIPSEEATAAGQAQSGSTTTSSGQTVFY